MQIRGEVIPVIDQSRRFHGTASTSARRRVLIVRTGDLTAGFIVDEVRSITRLPASVLRQAPDLGVEGMRLFDRVTAEGEGALAMIVNPQELLDRAERDMLADLGREGAKSRS
jgi:purine-binding chemotaxis protein CheW